MAKKTKNNKPMKRRSFLKGAGAAALGAATISSFPAPAISGGHMEWIACSAFGKAGLLGAALERFAGYINNQSDKLKITVYHANELACAIKDYIVKSPIRTRCREAAFSSYQNYWAANSSCINQFS